MDLLISDSDWESLSESGSEDQEETEFLYGGQAQSILSSLDESIGKIDDFLSFERFFFYGDTVCSVVEPSGQMGRVVNVDMLVDMENVHGKVIKDVNSKRLTRIRSILVGDYVIYGPWLGRVTKVVDCVSIMLDDGKKCEVTATDQKKLIPISPNLIEDTQYPYYPGQRVQIKYGPIFTSARWLCGTWNGSQTEGTVSHVKPGLVHVEWVASVLVGQDPISRAPSNLQDPEKLTLLSCFSHASWQLGDWCMLPIADRMPSSLGSTSHQLVKDNTNEQKDLGRDLHTCCEEIFVIVKTKTKIDVLWQDGSKSVGLDTLSLLPKDVINAHEFLPGQFVLEKGPIEEQHDLVQKRWGSVMRVNAKEQTVEVKWKCVQNDGENDAGQDWIKETVSAYELMEHPDYAYSTGNVVFRSASNKFVDKLFRHNVNTEKAMHLKTISDERDCVEEPENYYLSCIGTVTGFEDGAIEVKWAVGLTSKVAPSEISCLNKYESFTEASTVCEENIEQIDRGTFGHEIHSFNHEEKGLSDAYSDDELLLKKHSCESSSFSLQKCAIGILSSMFGNLFGTSVSGRMSTRLDESNTNCGTMHEGEEGFDLCTELQPVITDKLQAGGRTTSETEANEFHEIEDALTCDFSMLPDHFRQFDMVRDCSDHYFFDDATRGCPPTQVNRSWLKKIQQEWNILQKNLPETIYVRTYEERMDLMRAALVGAPGTPYHDGLFFFDIYFPPEYPHGPPLVHYRSGGLRLNPNLYESGKVCLSLLNTWTGTGSEVWNPGCSTILQVLLSLQALVLNDKPYFNEAGYESQIGKAEGEKNSVSYNENAFLVTCKTMLCLLRKPPKNFEALVKEHFRKRSQRILIACEAYMDGTVVGCAFDNVDGKSETGSSTGFRIMLAKILPKLVEALADNDLIADSSSHKIEACFNRDIS